VVALDVMQEIDSTLFLYPNFKNMATQEAPHIGHLIKEELARQERTVTWLASKLNYSRQNIYHLFKSQWIATDILLKICDIMNCNFFKVYSDYWENKKV
jgi:DNA-binding Xre family transcriptional regulator